MEKRSGRPQKFSEATERFTARYPGSLLKALDALAAKRGISRSDAMCEALAEWVARQVRRK